MTKNESKENEENSRPIKQNNFNASKWDEEDANIGDLAENILKSIPTYEEIEYKKTFKNNNSEPKPSSYVDDQWLTTCNIKFHEPKLPDENPPRLSIKPYHIFGYRAKDGHNNVKYIDNNFILYSAGKIGIIQDLINKEQKYFIKHKREICSICINYKKNLIATGEEYCSFDDDNNTTIRIWDSHTLEEKGQIVIPYNGVRALSFSLDDKYLVCCCLDEKHKIALIDANKKILVTEMGGSEKKILGIAFKSNNEFATVGLNHYKYWIINDDQLICKEYTNTLENFDNKLGVISVLGDYFVTGSSLGFLTLWKDNVNLKMKRCHNSQIDSLYSDNKIIISGGRDKTLTILDNDLTILKKIDLDFNQNEIINLSPRSIDIQYIKSGEKNINKILIGTSSGEILELLFEKNILDEEKPMQKIYNYSHFSINSSELNEITSITYWKKQNLFVSTSEDKTIRFWDLENKKQKSFIKIEEDIKPTTSSFSKQENIFAVGFNTGIIRFYSTSDFHVEKELKESNNSISAIKYSKDDDLIACATKDDNGNNIIDLFKTDSFYHYGTLHGAQKQIDGLDWSENSKFLVSFSHEKECRVFSIVDKHMISQYSDVDYLEWNTWTIAYGWPLKGYYKSKEGKIPIYACERFKLNKEDNYVIGIGDYNGCVKLYKYPIANKEQRCITNVTEHGQKITNIRFGKIENKNLLFTSSSDGCLIAWEIEQI